MKELLKTNIKNSFKIIAEDNPKIPPELIQVVDEEPSHFPSLVEELMKVAPQPVPWFYRDKSNNLQSPQQAFFGFYALRNIIRGILLSVRFIQAGDLLHKNHFIASSVFSYYTASFHLLHSFLSPYGRVIVDQVCGGPVKVIKRKISSEGLYCSLDPAPEVIVAILTKTNKWKFEPRPRSHARMWRELEHIFKELDFDIPDFFNSAERDVRAERAWGKRKVLLHLICRNEFSPFRGLGLMGAFVWFVGLVIYRIVETFNLLVHSP